MTGGDDVSEWDAGDLKRMLERIAETEGRNEEDVLYRMLSSYWVLDELEDVMEPPGAAGDADLAGLDLSDPAGLDRRRRDRQSDDWNSTTTESDAESDEPTRRMDDADRQPGEATRPADDDSSEEAVDEGTGGKSSSETGSDHESARRQPTESREPSVDRSTRYRKGESDGTDDTPVVSEGIDADESSDADDPESTDGDESDEAATECETTAEGGTFESGVLRTLDALRRLTQDLVDRGAREKLDSVGTELDRVRDDLDRLTGRFESHVDRTAGSEWWHGNRRVDSEFRYPGATGDLADSGASPADESPIADDGVLAEWETVDPTTDDARDDSGSSGTRYVDAAELVDEERYVDVRQYVDDAEGDIDAVVGTGPGTDADDDVSAGSEAGTVSGSADAGTADAGTADAGTADAGTADPEEGTTEGTGAAAADRVVEALRALRADVSDLDERQELLTERIERDFGDTAEVLAYLLARSDEHDEWLAGLEDAVESRLSDRLVVLSAELDAVEAEVEAVEDDLTDLDDAVATHDDDLDTLGARLRDLRAAINEDHDHVAEVLTYLVDRTEAFDERLGRLEGLTREARAERAAMRAEQDRLIELTTKADELGVQEARCAACGDSVDLTLLQSPQCPHCEVPYGGIDEGEGWFTSPTLTAGDPIRPGDGVDSEPADEGSTGDRSAADEGEVPVWYDESETPSPN
jgi:hypothetical protein